LTHATKLELGIPLRPDDLSEAEADLWESYTCRLNEMQVLATSDIDLVMCMIRAKLTHDTTTSKRVVAIFEQRQIPDPFLEAEQYAAQVLDGTITAGKYIKLAAQRWKNDLLRKDLYYDAPAAQHVVNFLKRYCNVSPMSWQSFLIANVYGFKLRENGLRRFRRVFVEIAKKQGKSTLQASLCLYHLCPGPIGIGERNAEVIICATGRQQAADVCFKMCCDKVKENPILNAAIKRHHLKLTAAGGNNVLTPVPSNESKQQGRSVSYATIDEYAFHSSNAMSTTMTSSGASRLEPIVASITTAGEQAFGNPAYDELLRAQQVLEGVIEADTYFPLLFTLDEGDNYKDESVWQKANPSLGITTQIAGIRNELQEAEQIPDKLAAFKRYSMNSWSSSVACAALNPDDLRAEGVWYLPGERDLTSRQRVDRCIQRLQGKERTKPLHLCTDAELHELMQKRQIFAGMDLSQSNDTSAFCLLAAPSSPDGYFEALFYAWCPGDDITRRARTDRLPYEVYAREGWIKPTDGPLVNNEVIEADVLALNKQFGIKDIGYDVRYMQDLARRLEKQGCIVTQCAQGWSLSPAIALFTQLVARHKFVIHGNPLAHWHFSNAAVNVGSVSGDMRLDKQRARERIDLTVAAVMALFVYQKSATPAGADRSLIVRVVDPYPDKEKK
jgi:phage terminase large subunit-like protein